VLLTHTDLDGLGCAVIYIAATGRDDYRLVENGAVDAAVAEALAGSRDVLLTDHSITEAMVPAVQAFIASGGSFALLDHHKSALALDRFEWARVDLSHSAAWLLWEHVGRPAPVEEFAHLVEDHDLWVHSDPRSSQLAALLGLLGGERFLERFSRSPAVNFTAGELLLLEVEDRRRADYIDRKVEQADVVEAGGRRWALCFAESYRSELAEALLDRLEVEGSAIVNATKATVSLRSRTIDVAAIAERMGGGGHARSAAFAGQGKPLEAGLQQFRRDLAAVLAGD
jgi:oligoribonuclease NrnB/cAMP/cGMP phosphodiesterase (DHH superfamily)